MRNDKDVKFHERYDNHPEEKSSKNSQFWKSCLAETAEEKCRRHHRRSLSADDSGSVVYYQKLPEMRFIHISHIDSNFCP